MRTTDVAEGGIVKRRLRLPCAILRLHLPSSKALITFEDTS